MPKRVRIEYHGNSASKSDADSKAAEKSGYTVERKIGGKSRWFIFSKKKLGE